ncbi:LA2681 family HEPN domain-containing protein [Cellvibrio japonicus]|uniref:LA2681-like HEPN domain-containing protein n=1 Tax=Cellvibrio japonicus (strain Ueda107) TaxID=498211 RepID=B3PCA2_CELJU|nr:LA2681 family HEPN domain-containing protein [Cellvibrio japonicus]ACE83393.1 hypothetical protein CJA_1216 [Cellvibrio japonicus Ueda107]QEI11814.1 hypothetical protein FY117_05915 [Cellvibrio japonicus]QEI15388.1 hypothetical protein FY116_05915 [Cellvibrio japonicus]QEI18967.1 hypothetical protein FY115_05915 [Cellvibrio japonicus]
MQASQINKEISKLSRLIDEGEFEKCFIKAKKTLKKAENLENKNIQAHFLLNISAILVDLGAMQPNQEAAKFGLKIMEENKDTFMRISGDGDYYYNLSNAKVNLITDKNPFNNTFKTIEHLIEIKSLLWRSLKSHKKQSDFIPPQVLVNLANILKRQFRITESLYFYDHINSLDLDIPQSWINRSETLMMLNQISGSYTFQMMHEVKAGYEKIISSKRVPPPWIDLYRQYIDYHEQKITQAHEDAGIDITSRDSEEHETRKEFDSLSHFRRFVLTEKLSLSEHGLYCGCVGSARDNLVIPTPSGVYGDFIPAMEMVLNRLKSEFSLARRFYYEYLHDKVDAESHHESCYSELFNDELLGIDIEKLRTAFRLCFGILDKIAAAICDLYDVHPPNGNVYFQSFWQLDREDRREKFEEIKTPGLLALYSLATDLNERKDGELAFFKQWRNDLEHKFLVIHQSATPADLYGSYNLKDKIIMISEDDFVSHLEHLLQITRSAIFSFVFCVREKGRHGKEDGAFYFPNPISSKD